MMTKEHRKMLRDYKMIPLFWKVVSEWGWRLLVVNVVTGEYRVLDK